MARPRKTFEVEEIKTKLNNWLASSTTSKEGRESVCTMLEFILHDTGNYHGFQYLDTEFLEPGLLKEDYDDTRRRYF